MQKIILIWDYFLYQLRFEFKKEQSLFILTLFCLFMIGISESRTSHFQKHTNDSTTVSRQHSIATTITPAFFQQWRENFLSQNKRTDSLGLVRGIFLGEDSFIPNHIKFRFRLTGLYHLLAASGFNCWIVAYFLSHFARFFFALFYLFFPLKISLQIKQWITPTAQLTGAWLFWLWSDQSVPITRAAILISTKTLFILLSLDPFFIRILAIQYLFSCLLHPQLWHNASFQLTYGCLFGMLLSQKLASSLRNHLWLHIQDQPYFRFVLKIFDYFVLNIGAVLGTIPITWLFFYEVNFTSILNNWFAVPIVSFWLMPSSLIHMIFCMPGLDQLFITFNMFLGTFSNQSALFLSSLLELSVKYLFILRYIN